MTRSASSAPPAGPPAPGAPPAPPLRRITRRKVVAGVCGGLGRHFDLDPVIFRVVTGVLAVTGGIGLLFYGFAWLLLPADEDGEETEGRRLLSGRVDGASLLAVLMALVGCGLFLTMLNNGGTVSFSLMLVLAVGGAALWSRRRSADQEPGPGPAAAHTVAEAPPETKAPPPPDLPSWWREPIVKDGTTGPVPLGYLWGPEEAMDVGYAAEPRHRPRSGGSPVPAAARGSRSVGGPRSVGGLVLLLAVLAGGLGTAALWGQEPLAVCLQTGLACALAVFALGLVVSSFAGRTGSGTVFMTVVTALLLAGSSALPHRISTDWMRTEWKPATVSEVLPRYELGSGVGTLDLSAVSIPAGQTVRTSAEVGAGRVEVVVPRNVTVKVTGQSGLGDLKLPDDPPGDIDIAPGQEAVHTVAPPKGTAPAGTLELKLNIAIGLVEVTRAAP
ncbi:PspC domain-containing protein [Streptomyces sp. ODS05-4]|uniref:PspC domain-containing protein n=1 Tax=Streptomyces sp. ODS05-4 TaxID=2944939 RepID=UPI00210890F1|nr:PspC domain-containing protein [Streptomyces sp. ODS05-4]